MKIKSLFARLVLWLIGWRTEGEWPRDVRKGVLVVAPHTSNWDFPIMLALALALRIKATWMGKHTLFRPPFGWIFRLMNGLPIDRTGRNNMVDQVVAAFRDRDRMILAVLPEGTRKRTTYWKSGFYHIANGAQVPMVLGFADYGRKVGGIGPTIMPSGDIEADMDKIRAFYSTMKGKRPEQFGEVRVRPPEKPGA